MKKNFLMSLLVAVTLFFVGCEDQSTAKRNAEASHQEQKQITKLNGKTMGTYWQVTIADPVTDMEKVKTKLEQALDEVNKDMSTYIPDSAISQFNQRHDKGAQKISNAFMHNVVAAREISEASNGVYDITVEPLVRLWGFGPDKVTQAPSKEAIAEALSKVGYKQLIIDEDAGTISKANPEMTIDLSSIAKGYGVDRLGKELSTFGFHNYLIDIGGEVLSKGNKYGQAWRVAVEQPTNGRHVEEVIAMTPHNGNDVIAMATSGNYRNFIDYDGAHMVHTIDPRTGFSVQSRLLSVSVIADSCMYADGYATAMMALGEKGAEAFAEAQGLPALFIYAAEQGGKGFDVVKNAAWQQLFAGD